MTAENNLVSSIHCAVEDREKVQREQPEGIQRTEMDYQPDINNNNGLAINTRRISFGGKGRNKELFHFSLPSQKGNESKEAPMLGSLNEVRKTPHSHSTSSEFQQINSKPRLFTTVKGKNRFLSRTIHSEPCSSVEKESNSSAESRGNRNDDGISLTSEANSTATSLCENDKFQILEAILPNQISLCDIKSNGTTSYTSSPRQYNRQIDSSEIQGSVKRKEVISTFLKQVDPFLSLIYHNYIMLINKIL